MMDRHLILYDGVCGLCNRLNRFVLKRDPAGVFQFASLQGGPGQSLLRAYGRDPDSLETLYVVVSYGSKSPVLLSKSRAALFVLNALGGPWRLVAIVGMLPRRLLDWAYDLVARNRYTLFGRYESCLLPSPEYKSRFIDA
jgi:predicted DCC family thiol-disulfide oxidoreductase YuxK